MVITKRLYTGEEKNEARNAMILLITVVKYIGLPISVEQLCEADLL